MGSISGRFTVITSILFTSSLASASSALIRERMENYKKISDSCRTSNTECSAEYTQAFRSLEPTFSVCLKASKDLSEDCSKLEKFVIEQVIPTSPIYSQVKKSLDFVKNRALASN